MLCFSSYFLLFGTMATTLVVDGNIYIVNCFAFNSVNIDCVGTPPTKKTTFIFCSFRPFLLIFRIAPDIGRYRMIATDVPYIAFIFFQQGDVLDLRCVL